MDWFWWGAYTWFERNAVLIAGIEFLLIVVGGPGRMIFWWVMERSRRHTERQRQRELMNELRLVEAEAERRHQELMDLRSVLSQLEMKPLGDSARVGALPDGTNIVETSNGQIRLALPVYISASFKAASPSMHAEVEGGQFVEPEPARLTRSSND